MIWMVDYRIYEMNFIFELYLHLRTLVFMPIGVLGVKKLKKTRTL